MSPHLSSKWPRLPKVVSRRTMRGFLMLLTVLLTLFIFTGCSLLPWNKDSANHPKISHKLNEQEDVINRNSLGTENLDKLDAFIERGSGVQRVVQHTIEGDPIFRVLEYKGGRLQYTVDTTEDAFGTPEVRTVSCAELERVETNTLLTYTLTGCDGEQAERQLLSIEYDVAKQDRFEFVLKYGVDRKNEINTGEQKLVKDLRNGSVAEVNDYTLPDKDRQSIYRELVLSSDLEEEKQLSTECNRKPYISYELTVQINGAERHYVWSECDTSTDGLSMTGVAQFIIDTVEANEAFKQLPEAEGGYE
ncbi:hypothetical protein A3842_05750 [Paenibacillus sp. P3E]|uniref:DUF4362 domain-containing protein n=1 Tax=Paenibacillus sp. P3E TaxID=1349435 RepID=UPI00093E34FB|nr:DUF4362 domain-containing protein [Paenibacillus sp. P3E]OKP88110.1 hypothetical protein A3842_05750 [Paenibacillus sp. P3E]